VAYTETANNPLAAVIGMLGDLKTKVLKDKDSEAAAYQEYKAWCDKVTADQTHNIKVDEGKINKLKAKIDKYFADIEDSGEKIEQLIKAIASASHDAKAAKDIREKQHSDFVVSEKELVEAIDALSRAITIIEREMQKGGAALVQMQDHTVSGMLQALGTITDAAALSSGDRSKLMALVQSQQQVSDDEFAAPAAAAYSSQSGNILEMLGDMKDKAENQLSDMRQAETKAKYSYNQLQQALKVQKEADEKDLAKEKDNKAEAIGKKADAEKDLKKTQKAYNIEAEQYQETTATCMQTASDYQAAVESRNEELKVIGEATEILESMAGGAAAQTYSFLQERLAATQRLQTSADLAHFEVVSLVRHMAKIHHSAALAQLASRMVAVIKFGAGNGDDPFAKVKGLIIDLIAKLQKQAEKDANNKAYCDEQLAETGQKAGELEEQLKKLTTAIDQSAAESAEIKEDVKELQAELAQLAREQAEMDKIRADEKAAFETAKADLELGIEGVRKALSVLRDYYGNKDESAAAAVFVQDMKQPSPPDLTHKKGGGAAAGIIDILEMTESDFATSLAKEQTEETDSQNDYEKTTAENAVVREAKEQDVKFKTQEFKALDNSVNQLTYDKDSALTEQGAVLEYSSKVKDKCVAKPETYEERKKRRDAEITGLKEALEILKNEAALMQRKRRGLRGGSLLA